MAVTEARATAGHGVDPAFAEEFDGKFLAAFNTRDADALLALLSDDVTYVDPSWPAEMHGHADVRDYLSSVWRASSDMSVDHVQSAMLDPQAPRMARLWHLTGTSDGVWDPPGLKPSGKKMDFQGVGIFEFRGERACEVRMCFDVAQMMRQVGALAPSRSMGERLTVLLVNLKNGLHRR